MGIVGLKHERVFFPVSDNGANMVAGWVPFGGGRCAVHTAQLSAKEFLDHAAIKPTREKQKGIVAHFNKSTGVDGLNGFFKCARQCKLPEHHPVSACDTRWSSDHDQMEGHPALRHQPLAQGRGRRGVLPAPVGPRRLAHQRAERRRAAAARRVDAADAGHPLPDAAACAADGLQPDRDLRVLLGALVLVLRRRPV
mmetsp:Transcript_21575/g.72824  ORF Transcript_21575/g.72824 Transcript_21575/m.72824 type:complete len:196 (+) Transcript_21575:1208-1795(+)